MIYNLVSVFKKIYFSGIHEDEQIQALLSMQDLVSKMYFKTSKGNLGKKQFQSGISVSIKATLDLFYELKAEGIQYLLTSRINQDGLENLFSTIRLMGGNDSHPSARDFANRMRNLCLTKNISLVVNNPSVELSDTDEFISSVLFDSATDNTSFLNSYTESEPQDLEDRFHDFKCEVNEGRNYVAGYITKKLNLPTAKTFNKSNWIHFKGAGKLKQPTQETVEICATCDLIFNEFNRSSLRICQNPLGKVKDLILRRHPTYPPRIVDLFCKVYFYSRIRQISKDIKLKKIKKSVRTLKQLAQFIN